MTRTPGSASPWTLTRRQFHKAATAGAAAVAAPTILPSSVFGQPGRPAPSERITLGCIGVGGMGGANLHEFLQQPDCHVVAVCDVDANHLRGAKARVDQKYQNTDCATYEDYRELCARKDIDAVSMATPDHWHALTSIEAARNGKDVYGEKPFSHSLLEGRAMIDALTRHQRVWQTGSWQRSFSNFRFGCELVRNGRLGKIVRVEVGLPSGPFRSPDNQTPTQPPEGFNYDMWLGPAPWSPYTPEKCVFQWRWNLDYGGGQLTDWVGHHCDIAHWGLGNDDTIGPLEVAGSGEYIPDGIYNCASRYRLTMKYPGDIEFIMAGGHRDIEGGAKWIGESGHWVRVDRGWIDAYPKSLLQEKIGPEEIHLFTSPGHHRNFLDCVKSRKLTLTPAEVAHRSVTPGHLGQIAMLTGRKLRWDAARERILGDPAAQGMLGNAYRGQWRL